MLCACGLDDEYVQRTGEDCWAVFRSGCLGGVEAGQDSSWFARRTLAAGFRAGLIDSAWKLFGFVREHTI